MAVNSTAIWRARPSGSNTNGGGYDPGISGAATDYSQQNSAQASGTHGSGVASTTFTDATAAAFTAAMVGNAINISGQGFYFITAFTNASNVVVDRALGTFSGASWSIGGGWADFWTNEAVYVAGNTIYVLGSGTPNPSSYTYDYTWNTASSPPNGSNSSGGQIFLLNDPSTPGYKSPPDTTGGMPCIKSTQNQNWSGPSYYYVAGLYFVAATSIGNAFISPGGPFTVEGCVCDQFGLNVNFTTNCNVIACEVFSSVNGSGSVAAIVAVNNGIIIDCNIHDTTNFGIDCTNANVLVKSCIIAKCAGNGILLNSSPNSKIINNTIDGNASNGIENSTSSSGEIKNTLITCTVFNNIISNHTGVGAYGIKQDAGSASSNAPFMLFWDYNVFYNNTANYQNMNAGVHDTALVTTPYVASSTENYTLA
jgi:hypothetical protein